MNVIVAKWVVLVTLFVLTVCFSMLPLRLLKTFHDAVNPVKRIRYGRIISLLSCFAAGVFMATCLLDLFPEVNEILEKTVSSLNTKFPIAEFSVAFGFFLVLVVEQIVLDCRETPRQSLDVEESFAEEDLNGHRKLYRHDSIEGISDHPHTDEEHSADDEDPHSSFRSFLLLTALSLHSLFEGLAIGLQPDVASVLQIFIAVILHKSVIAFSLGLNLVQSQLKLGAIIKSNVLFCITSPVGMGIAMTLEEFGHAVHTSVINGILQGLACGTFVYITFFEVLPHELNKGRDRLLKLLAVLIGFSVVCGVLFLEP